MKKILWLITLVPTLGALSTVSVTNQSQYNIVNLNTKFNFKNLMKAEGIASITKGNNNNLYITTHTKTTSKKNGLKIQSYDLKTKQITTIWQNKLVDTFASPTVVDKNGVIYLGSDGGLQIIKNNKMIQIPGPIGGKITNLTLKNDILYVTNFTSLFTYNINTGLQQQIKLKNDHKLICVNVDDSNNIYLGTQKGAYILKNGETNEQLINSNDDFKTSKISNIYINNNKGYFSTYASSEISSKIYVADTGSIKATLISNFENNQTVNALNIFSINNKIMILTTTNNLNSRIWTLNNNKITIGYDFAFKNYKASTIVDNNLFLLAIDGIDDVEITTV